MASTTATTPGILSFPRITTLIASLLVSLSSGTNYVYSAYSPQLGSRLRISHTQLNIVALAGNVGVYATGPLWGRIVDARGPRVLLAGAFVSLLAGYSGIRYLYNAAEGSISTSQLSFCALVLCSFMTGVGGNGGLTSAVNTTAKSFPEGARATTTGLVLSGFGLSAFFFSVIAHVAFGTDVSSFLLLLALGTSIPMIFGLFFVRPIPLPEHESTRNAEYGLVDGGDGEIPAVAPAVFPNDSQTPLLFSHDDREEDEDEDEVRYNNDDDLASAVSTPTPRYVVPVTLNALELSPTRSNPSNNSRHRSRSSVSRRIPDRVARAVDELPNIHGTALALSGDFWILSAILSLLTGTGLMYINNVGSMSQALSAQGDSSYDEERASRWQAAQVSTLSITNFLGRILIGLTSDLTKNRLHYPRTYCIPLVALLFLFSQIAATMIDDVRHLWRATALLGLAYGSVFGLFPTVTIEMFGLAHFSENWGYMSLSTVFGGNLFSVAFGRNLDAHTPPDVTSHLLSSTEAQCREGRRCYVDALYMTIVACIVALILGVWAGWRERRKLSERVSAVGSKDDAWRYGRG